MFKARSPHRSSCSRRARKERRPSTEIRLGVDSALGARKTSSTFFVLGKAFASERAPPERCQEESVGIPHPRLTRGAFTDKGTLVAWCLMPQVLKKHPHLANPDGHMGDGISLTGVGSITRTSRKMK